MPDITTNRLTLLMPKRFFAKSDTAPAVNIPSALIPPPAKTRPAQLNTEIVATWLACSAATLRRSYSSPVRASASVTACASACIPDVTYPDVVDPFQSHATQQREDGEQQVKVGRHEQLGVVDVDLRRGQGG